MSDIDADVLRLKLWREAGEEVIRRREEKRRKYDREWTAKWRAENPEKSAEADKRSKLKNKDKVAARQKKYREVNRDRISNYQVQYREDNRERARRYAENYRKENPGLVAERKRRSVERGATRPRPEVCEACGKPCKTGKSIGFDHCHLFGRFRGWLCQPCNTALGILDDDPKRLKALIAYLMKYDHE